MNVYDLMIGDLVQFDEDTCVIEELRVDGTAVLVAMNTDLTSVDGDQVDEEELSPIELTEDILEKNGFRHSISHNDWTNADCNFFLYEGGNGFRIQNTDIRLEYVHQLQHLLRLCGIEKEVKL